MLTIKLQDFVYIVIHFFPNISNVKNICTAKSLSKVGKRCLGIQSRMIPMYHLSSFTSTLPHKKFLHSRENKRNKTFFKKNGHTRPLFLLFLVFPNKQYNFYNKTMWKMSKYQSSIRRRDSNTWPFEREPSPITTRPGLPP